MSQHQLEYNQFYQIAPNAHSTSKWPACVFIRVSCFFACSADVAAGATIAYVAHVIVYDARLLGGIALPAVILQLPILDLISTPPRSTHFLYSPPLDWIFDFSILRVSSPVLR